jgi:creatinine amidohydrolase
LALNLKLRPECVVVQAEKREETDLLGLPVSGFGTLNFQGLTIDAPVEFGETGSDAIAMAWQARDAVLGEAIAEALVAAAAEFVAHFSVVAAKSGR